MASIPQHGASKDTLATDPRWQLAERIASSPPFQKSGRLRDLLLYVTETTLQGKEHELTEQNIGHAVFGKAADYSPTEDSSVRVYIRQLRLKLHEYFDVWGQNEPLIIEIPKGNYIPAFRSRHGPASTTEPKPAEKRRGPFLPGFLPWALSGILAVAFIVLGQRTLSLPHRPVLPVRVQPQSPWPLSEVFSNRQRTYIVTADANYGMLRIMAHKSGSLDDYLRSGFPRDFLSFPVSKSDASAVTYIAHSLLTSYADVSVTATLLKLAGPLEENNVYVRSARDLRLRDLRTANYIFLGSPSSNPWVSLFEKRLNFVESEGKIGDGRKYFLNKHPLPREKTAFEGLMTGTEGEDYATISMVPSENGDGSVLILQGLQQAGTEATGQFLADPKSRIELLKALGFRHVPKQRVWFEALIHTQFMENAPSTIHLVEARLIH